MNQMKHRGLKLFTLPLLVAGLGLSTALAQEKPPAQKKPDGLEQNTEESRATQWALETGRIAGGATFCALDPEVLETYILHAQARIASEAHNDVDLVVARITFNNTLDTSSIKEPKGGCEGFDEVFTRELARLK